MAASRSLERVTAASTAGFAGAGPPSERGRHGVHDAQGRERASERAHGRTACSPAALAFRTIVARGLQLLGITSKRVKVTGGSLFADIEGDGPPVVLVHSGVTDGRQWEQVSDLVGRRMTVVRYDRRGYGRSAKSKRGSYSAALDLIELIDGLHLGRVVACGNSAGGQAVLEAAAIAPDRFARLVLLAPSLPVWDWGERASAYGHAEEAALGAGDIDRAVELNLEMWVRDPAHREPVAIMLRRALENQRKRPFLEIDLDPPVTDRLAEIHIPVHLLVGEHDLDEFRAIAWHLADRLPQATAEEVPGAGHLLGLERPELVAAAL